MYNEYASKYGQHIVRITFVDSGWVEWISTENLCQIVRSCCQLASLIVHNYVADTSTAHVLVAGLQHCPDLRILQITAPAGDVLFNHLNMHASNLLRLETLVLGSDLTRSLPFLLACTPEHLRHLEIKTADPHMLVKLLPLFGQMVNLTSLSLHSASELETILALVRSCPQIEELTIAWCMNMSSDGAAAIIRALRRLRSFALETFVSSGDYLLELVSCHQNTVESLTVHCFDLGTARHLNTVLRSCQCLRTLHVCVTSVFLFDTSLLGNITSLTIYCDDVDEDADSIFGSLIPHTANLQHLDITAGTFILVTLQDITSKHFPHLHTLRLSSPNLSDDLDAASVQYLQEKLQAQLPCVEVTLDIGGC